MFLKAAILHIPIESLISWWVLIWFNCVNCPVVHRLLFCWTSLNFNHLVLNFSNLYLRQDSLEQFTFLKGRGSSKFAHLAILSSSQISTYLGLLDSFFVNDGRCFAQHPSSWEIVYHISLSSHKSRVHHICQSFA